MTRVITWNMEGGTHDHESKWHTGVQALLTQAEADVLCLQEAGPLPASAQIAPPPPIPVWLVAPPPGFNWKYATWSPGVTQYHILWAQTDQGGNRVNLAMVSVAAPTGLWYIAPGLPTGRPAIGIATAGTNIFSLHALSGGGGDAPGLVTNIAAAVGGGVWDVGGDYNREPATWVPPVGNLCPPNKATRWKSGKKLDYMVRSGAVITGIVIDSLVLSDHYPVLFDI